MTIEKDHPTLCEAILVSLAKKRGITPREVWQEAQAIEEFDQLSRTNFEAALLLIENGEKSPERPKRKRKRISIPPR